jgi:hypothetical protein
LQVDIGDKEGEFFHAAILAERRAASAARKQKNGRLSPFLD